MNVTTNEQYCKIENPKRPTMRYRILSPVWQIFFCIVVGFSGLALTTQTMIHLLGAPSSVSDFNFLIIIIAAYGVIFFLVEQILAPLILGNRRICRWFSKELAEVPEKMPAFVVEVAFRPRVLKSFIRLIDSADDVGVLKITNRGIEFEGDYVRFATQWSNIERIRAKRTGVNYSWFWGKECTIFLKEPVDEIRQLWVIVREGQTVITTSSKSRDMVSRLQSKVK